MRSEVVGTLTIASGQQDSGVLAHSDLSSARRVVIYGPATLPETITVRVAVDPAAAFASLADAKYNGGAAITFSGQSAMVLDFGGFNAIGLHAGAATGGARTFTVVAQF